MRLLGKWFLLLSKRLYKKASFLILLLLIPASVAVFALTAKQDSGLLRVALTRQAGGSDTQVIDSLLQENGAILFSYAQTPEEAEDLVRAGKVDEAWIFPGDAFTALRETYGHRKPVVQVITRQDTGGMHLVREKIPDALYEYCAKVYYLEYIRANVPQLAALSDGELLAYFDGVQVSEDFFAYGNPTDRGDAPKAQTYLTAPLRGLLAIFMLLGGMAATMFYMQDTAAGTFSLVKVRYRGLVALGSVMTAVVHISAVGLLSLLLASLAGSLLTELAILLLYALCCSAFCLLLKALLPGIRSYCAVLPLLTVVMLGVCPVFMDFRKLSVLQHIFPPTYYINAVYDRRNLFYMAIYSVCCLLLAHLAERSRPLYCIENKKDRL